MRKIGILFGMEDTFPWAFINEINARKVGDIVAEPLQLGGTNMEEECPYRVIVDRISHEIKYYRSYLKAAAVSGTYVINNPFWWSADDKFFECVLSDKLGVAVPKTVVLPSKSYPEGVVDKSLRNMIYPLDWKKILEYVGLPAFLKPVDGGGWKNVYKIHNLDELFQYYNETGQLCMILQEYIEFEQYIRCFCIGKDLIIPVKYDPAQRRYIVEHDHLSKELGERVVEDARKLNHALDYDMNTVEFAVRRGVPYAIDFMNPAPDFDRHSITEHYFKQVVGHMADLAIDLAKSDKKTADEQHWYHYLNSHSNGKPPAASSGKTIKVGAEKAKSKKVKA